MLSTKWEVNRNRQSRVVASPICTREPDVPCFPKLAAAGELFPKGRDFYHKIEGPGEVENESALRLELRNGSRIVALPGSEATVMGYSGADFIVMDEGARVSDDS